MKENSNTVYIVNVMLILLIAGCQKEIPVNANTPVPGNPGTTPVAQPPGTGGAWLRAHAGSDHTVMISPDFFKLTGYAEYLGLNNPALRWHWTPLSGPSNPLIEFVDSGYSKVRNLVPGRYDFELTVSVLPDYVARDTVSVEIRKLAPVLSNVLILNSSNWVCDWGFCNLEIPGTLNLIPAPTAFLVYLKRDFFSEWLLVENYFQTENHWSGSSPEYYYFLVGGHLTISVMGDNFTDNAKVKLVY
jgi:hypothetical protein